MDKAIIKLNTQNVFHAKTLSSLYINTGNGKQHLSPSCDGLKYYCWYILMNRKTFDMV